MVQMSMQRLRRAWLHELGIEHVWATPGGVVVAAAVPESGSVPATATVADPPVMPLPLSGAGTQPLDMPAAAVRQAGASVSPEPTVTAGGTPSSRDRSPRGWLAWQAQAEGQPEWMILSRTDDAGAPEAQAFLAAMMRALGRRVEVLATPRRGEGPPPAAVVAVGAVARAALGCPQLGWMQVGEGRLRGQPVRVLALPPLADVAAAAEGKAPAWRGLLRLGQNLA